MRNLLIIIASIFITTVFASCNKDNTVKANPDYVVLRCGESVEVDIVGQHTRCDKDGIELHNLDSIFSISDIKRKSLVVTGENIGIDTLIFKYMQGGHIIGAYVEVPVTVVE